MLEIEDLSFPNDAWDSDTFLDYFESCTDLFLVAKAGRRIVGYAITCVHKNRAELASIAVDPASRTLGVGTAMIRFTLQELRRKQVANWFLMVRITNESAIRFYQRFGFVRTKTVRDYYGAGSDAWRMRWSTP